MNLFAKPDSVPECERQLAVLIEAVDRAQNVARALSNSLDSGDEVKLLSSRLEAVRREVEQLRRVNRAPRFEEIDPKWTGLLPWRAVSER